MVKNKHSKHFSTLKMTILSLFITGLLTGCGVRGPLKTPPPLFGGDTKVDANNAPTEDLDTLDDEEDEFLDLDVETQDSLADI